MKHIFITPWTWVQVSITVLVLFGVIANVILAVLTYVEVSR